MKIKRKGYPKIQLILICLFSCVFIYCTIPKRCSDVKYGHFYFYGKSTGNSYQIIREDSLQLEVNANTNDTSFWKINWIDECSYKLKYLHGGGSNFSQMKDFLIKHTTCIQIREVKPEFYVFKVSLDSFNSNMSLVDTAWMKAK